MYTEKNPIYTLISDRSISGQKQLKGLVEAHTHSKEPYILKKELCIRSQKLHAHSKHGLFPQKSH